MVHRGVGLLKQPADFGDDGRVEEFLHLPGQRALEETVDPGAGHGRAGGDFAGVDADDVPAFGGGDVEMRIVVHGCHHQGGGHGLGTAGVVGGDVGFRVGGEDGAHDTGAGVVNLEEIVAVLDNDEIGLRIESICQSGLSDEIRLPLDHFAAPAHFAR